MELIEGHKVDAVTGEWDGKQIPFFYTVSTSSILDVFCCIIPDLWCVFVNLDISLVTMSCCFVVMVKFFNIYICYMFGSESGWVTTIPTTSRFRRLATLGSSLATTFCGGHQVGPGTGYLKTGPNRV